MNNDLNYWLKLIDEFTQNTTDKNVHYIFVSGDEWDNLTVKEEPSRVVDEMIQKETIC